MMVSVCGRSACNEKRSAGKVIPRAFFIDPSISPAISLMIFAAARVLEKAKRSETIQPEKIHSSETGFCPMRKARILFVSYIRRLIKYEIHSVISMCFVISSISCA